MTVLCAYDAAGQDTRAQESRKARLEREIAVIDKQLKDNAAKSLDAMATLNLVRKNIHVPYLRITVPVCIPDEFFII